MPDLRKDVLCLALIFASPPPKKSFLFFVLFCFWEGGCFGKKTRGPSPSPSAVCMHCYMLTCASTFFCHAITPLLKKARDFDAVGVDGTSIQLEAKLRRIATRGAVALFNAVRKAQKDDEAIVGVSKSMYANKDVKSMDKKDFLGLLASKTAGIHGEPSNKGDAGGSVATGAGAGAGEEGAGEDGSGSGASGGTGQGWSVLQDNYMLESKADDWDKDDASSEEDGSELEDPDDDDDDDEDD